MSNINRLNAVLLKHMLVDSSNMKLSLCLINDILSIDKNLPPLRDLSLVGCKIIRPLDSIRIGINLFTNFRFEGHNEIDLIFYGNYMDPEFMYFIQDMNEGTIVNLISGAQSHKIYTLKIVNFDVAKHPDEYPIVNCLTHNGEIVDNLKFIAYEIPQFEENVKNSNKQIIDFTNMERWLAYFSRATTEDEIIELGKIDERIALALSLEKDFFSEEKNVLEYEKIEKENFDAIEVTKRVY